MGRFEVKVKVSSLVEPQRSGELELLVDTGATLSWLPRAFLERIGVKPIARSRFQLPDGRYVEREKGAVLLSVNGQTVAVTAAFAEPGEAAVLGATALETLGLAVDPVKQELVPQDLYI
ncbi:MAG: aspartyl protease family protein [Gammaproteobacteria bacterium]